MRKKIKGYDSGGFLEGMTDMMSTVSKGRDAIDKFKAGRKASGKESSSVGSDSGGTGSTVSKGDPEGSSLPSSSAPTNRVKDDDANATSFARGGKVRKVADNRSAYMKGKR